MHGIDYSAHGCQLGPIRKQVQCDLITKGKDELPIEAIRPVRFNCLAKPTCPPQRHRRGLP